MFHLHFIPIAGDNHKAGPPARRSRWRPFSTIPSEHPPSQCPSPQFHIPSAVSSLSVLCLTHLVVGLECASSTPSDATVFQDLLDEAITSQGGRTPLWAREWGVCSSLLCASP